MNHLDEGTIHAWLDGALNAGESRDIEAHIATCATCSAAVAEARGLIAASSRILGALDDVPGGVIPKPATVPAAIVAGGASAKPRARRVWRAAPWVTGIAAVLVAAVVLQTTDMASERAMTAIEQEMRPTAAPPADSQQELSAVNAPAPVANARPLEAQAAARDTTGGAGSAGAARGGGATAGAPSPARASSAERQSFAAAPPSAAAPVAQRTVDAQAKAQVANAESRAASDMVRGTVAGVAAGDSASASRLRVRAPEEIARRTAQERQQTIVTSIPAQITGIATPGPMESLRGCYRLSDATRPADLSPQRAEVGRAAASTARRQPAPAAAPSPAPSAGAARGDLADAATLIIRLDTARLAAGHAVISASNDTVGSWRLVGDSARVDLGVRGVIAVDAAQKVTCPER